MKFVNFSSWNRVRGADGGGILEYFRKNSKDIWLLLSEFLKNCREQTALLLVARFSRYYIKTYLWLRLNRRLAIKNMYYVVLMVVVSWTSAVRLRAVRRSENSGAGGVLIWWTYSVHLGWNRVN